MSPAVMDDMLANVRPTDNASQVMKKVRKGKPKNRLVLADADDKKKRIASHPVF